VDSNIPMYVAGRDHPLREPARRFLERARSGDVAACTSTEVLQEILYRYVGLRRLDAGRQVYEDFAELCPVVFPVTLADTDRAKEFVCSGAGIGIRDAIHAAVMVNNGVRHIASFDAGFERVRQIERFPLT